MSDERLPNRSLDREGARMKHKVAIIAAISAVFVIVGMTAALALVQTNGNGKTALGNTLGFNAQADLSGNFEYQFDVNGVTYNVHCNDYTKYVATTTPNGKYPKSLVSATNCFDTNGVQYYVHAEFVDRGEPGTSDGACITVKVFPGSQNPVLEKDCGIIQKGNIQIHPTNTPADALMVSTP
jgi:hypothetical protein